MCLGRGAERRIADPHPFSDKVDDYQRNNDNPQSNAKVDPIHGIAFFVKLRQL
jgi:hypothetical protein